MWKFFSRRRKGAAVTEDAEKKFHLETVSE